MDERQLATYAYHNCEFQRAIELAQAGAPCETLAAVHVKALSELDEKAGAVLTAERYLSIYPCCGVLHYLLGVTRYLAGQPKSQIEAAFLAAAECGSPTGAMGLGFLEAASQRYANAVRLLTSITADDPELEHARHLSLFQTLTLQGELPAAEIQLERADRLLSRTPSLLRQLWGQLCWIRLLRAKRRFDGALALLERVLAQVDPQAAPRLYRNAIEAQRQADAQSSSPNLRLPVDDGPSQAPPSMRAAAIQGVTRKPMLNSLYTYLSARGRAGATKEELVTNVWEESYNPVVHDDRIYKAIGRLRHLLGDDRQTPRILTQLGRSYILHSEASTATEPETSGG